MESFEIEISKFVAIEGIERCAMNPNTKIKTKIQLIASENIPLSCRFRRDVNTC